MGCFIKLALARFLADALLLVQRLARRIVASRRLLLWLTASWAVAVAVPAVLLYPEHGLDRPALLVLLGLAPLGALLGAATAQPWMALAAGLAGLMPPLVACPALHQQPASRPFSSLLLALVLLIACDAAARQGRGEAGRLRWLVRWPQHLRGRWLAGLGLLWLALAWLPTPDGWSMAEGTRAVRIAGAAAVWSLVAGSAEKPWRHRVFPSAPSLIGRRLAWLALLGGLLLAWRSTGS